MELDLSLCLPEVGVCNTQDCIPESHLASCWQASYQKLPALST